MACFSLRDTSGLGSRRRAVTSGILGLFLPMWNLHFLGGEAGQGPIILSGTKSAVRHLSKEMGWPERSSHLLTTDGQNLASQ